MPSSIMEIFFNLVNHTASLIVVIYILTRTGIFSGTDRSGTNIKKRLMIVFLFGLLAIYGTIDSINIFGAQANVRDLGPMIAGLIGGPWVGLGAGVIGGIHRYLFGGLTRFPCALATIFAGLAGGLVFKLNKGFLLKPWTAILFAAGLESFHMLLVLALARPYDQALLVVKEIAVPMIVANSLGLLLFVLIVRNYKREQEAETARKKIESDLNVAHDIQVSMLPRIYPPFPNRKEFSIFATMEPAREVGGDFFDYALISDNRLYFVIGDVSDKGVSAALFMVICKTLLKIEATQYAAAITPSKILYYVNNKLCPDNDACMFVTIFCGILDITTGELQYANAGHNPPLICREDGCEFLEVSKGMAMGVMEETQFGSDRIVLKPEHSLLLYTDGVTEAMNRDGRQFTPERLRESLGRNSSPDVKDMVQHVKSAVAGFVKEADQSDDLTVLALKYHGYSA